MLLLRRLWCPLPLSASSCRCGRPLDPSAHHGAVSTRRGFGPEGVIHRERGSTRAQRGRGESDNKRARPGLGSATQSRGRQPPIGGGGSRLTPQWCLRCAGTDLRAGSAPPGMELQWSKPTHGNCAPIPNLPRLTRKGAFGGGGV